MSLARLLVSATAALLVTACEPAEPLHLGFVDSPWRGAVNRSVSRTLAHAGIRGCGEYYWRAHDEEHETYLVYCYRESPRALERWTAYIVWPAISAVEGPFHPITEVPIPTRDED